MRCVWRYSSSRAMILQANDRRKIFVLPTHELTSPRPSVRSFVHLSPRTLSRLKYPAVIIKKNSRRYLGRTCSPLKHETHFAVYPEPRRLNFTLSLSRTIFTACGTRRRPMGPKTYFEIYFNTWRLRQTTGEALSSTSRYKQKH